MQWSTDRANEIDFFLTDESKGKSLPRNLPILPATISGELKSSSTIRLTIPLWRSDTAAKRAAIRSTAQGASLFSAALWLGVLLFASGLLASAFQHDLPMGVGHGTAMRAGIALVCGALVPRFFQNGAYGIALGLVLIVGNMYFVREGEIGLYLAGALFIAYDLFPGLIARGMYVVALAFGGAAVFGQFSTGNDRAWFGAISVAALLMAIHLTRKQTRMEKQR